MPSIARYLPVVCLILANQAGAAEAQVGVAANFAEPIKAIAAVLTKTTGHTLKITLGATGKLYAQIQNGAPFDVLLAADTATPEKLAQEGLGMPGSRFTYATGKQVLWSADAKRVDARGDVLKTPNLGKVSYANPKVAPYGAGTVQVIDKVGLTTALAPKLGSAVANITGSGDFDVVWESNDGNTFVGATLQNAAPGTYKATVTDELGCEVTASITLNAPSPLTLNANVIAVSCLDDKNGEIQVFASGGIPGIYQYQWSNGIFGNQIRFLGAGNYTVTATDLNGCDKVEIYALADPTPILVTFDIEPATEGFNGTVRAIVSGGQMPYRYEWVNLNSSDFSSVVSSLAPGEYYLIVTDDNA